MTLAERFVVLAAECERMSEMSLDQTNKAAWLRMAERWKLCAVLERQHARGPARQRSRRTRLEEAPLH
jgi:hypothetical protein